MKYAKIYVEKDLKLADVDDRLFSSFLEHLGRAVYTGIYEPGHPAADSDGYRRDVLELVRELKVSHIRYPGGNFLSGYRWKDGVGPKESRPRRLDLAWHTIESNAFGIDEFYDWSQKAGTQIMAGVNMGTGTPQEAGELVEYCNFPGGTDLSDLRIRNGHRDPMNIKLWCVGNEMDGEWQICHMNAEDYGKKAVEAAKIMRWVDSSIELVACGSATSLQETYPEWDRVVLEHTYEYMDYLSLHRYYENEGNSFDFLASFQDTDNFIHTIEGTADYVKALKRSKKTMYLSFDEWNIWYQKKQKDHPWEEAPAILEDRYSLLDALAFAGIGMSLLNHADRVKIACLAQLVNVIAPILTEKGGRVLRQSTFYPFQCLSQYGRGTVLKALTVTEKRESRYGDTPLLQQSTVFDEEHGMVTIFCLNIAAEPMTVELDLRSFGKPRMCEHFFMAGDNLNAVNTFDDPFAVTLRSAPVESDLLERCSLMLPACSFHVLRFQIENRFINHD